MSAHVIEVVVRGRLSPELVVALDSFEVTTGDDGFTRIVGSIADQAQLLGILDLLDDLHIEVVSINRVTTEGSGT